MRKSAGIFKCPEFYGEYRQFIHFLYFNQTQKLYFFESFWSLEFVKKSGKGWKMVLLRLKQCEKGFSLFTVGNLVLNLLVG